MGIEKKSEHTAECESCENSGIINKERNISGMIVMYAGIFLFILQLAVRLNALSFAAAGFVCGVSALIFLLIIFKRKLTYHYLVGYGAALAGIWLYYIIFGADSGFGAFAGGKEGFSTAANTFTNGDGNFGTRLVGNSLLALPCALVLAGIVLTLKYAASKPKTKKITITALCGCLMLTSAIYMMTMNFRSKPNMKRMFKGQEDYLANINKTASDSASPNVLYILMDDMGYGDISHYGGLIETPNIDSIAANGLAFENFYSSYSICSPARFAALTGRYPYRGYGDNVWYPTVQTLNLASYNTSRIFNTFNGGANVDGMPGDEITVAEMLGAAGYNTGAFGKWHLGDYGEYLPTNQGFDYFYGSYYVNDMQPFNYVREENGQSVIVNGTEEMKEQKYCSELLHEEIDGWVRDAVKNSDKPFFAYYASPWPHAPVAAGDAFKGKTGLGTYGDCIAEFDFYLGELFNTLEELGELDNTIIMFTSDNGPALEGSTAELRGGKGSAYEGGQKMPFLMRWDNNPQLFSAGSERTQSAASVDIFPTLLDLCGISYGEDNLTSHLPEDRIYDGRSMLPLIKDDTAVHTADNPILYMKNGDVHAVQYSVPVSALWEAGDDYAVTDGKEYVSFKYFPDESNDNPGFKGLSRKGYLYLLTDDGGENYNRAEVYPTVAAEMKKVLNDAAEDLKNNRRGIK